MDRKEKRVCRGPWVTGSSPTGHHPTAQLLQSVTTRCLTRTHIHRDTYTHHTLLTASVVRIAAESCEAKTLIKTTDHFLQERERRRGRGCNLKQNYRQPPALWPATDYVCKCVYECVCVSSPVAVVD